MRVFVSCFFLVGLLFFTQTNLGCGGPTTKEKTPEKAAEKAAEATTETVVNPEEKVSVPEDGGQDKTPEPAAEKKPEPAAEKKPETPADGTPEKAPESAAEKKPETPADATPEIAKETLAEVAAEKKPESPAEASPETSANQPDPNAAPQIQALRAGTLGSVDKAAVTYLKKAIGNDPAGFFIQATQTGPALFVAVDPTTTTPPLNVGDIISFAATKINPNVQGRVEVETLASLVVHGSGYKVAALVQDVSSATDLITALTNYESELVTFTGKLLADFTPAGGGFIGGMVETAGVTGLRLRIPAGDLANPSIAERLELTPGCTFTAKGIPMWRFTAEAQPSPFQTSEITITSCDPPALVKAEALSATSVRLHFSRSIAPASVMGNGSQITFDKGLTASAATVQDKTITVTTSNQTAGDTYQATAAGSIQDKTNKGVDPAKNQTTFKGFSKPAIVLINEVNANITSGCDLIELRVKEGGSLDGFKVMERTTTILTFQGLTVQKNDYIVIHINGNSTTCNPGTSTSETASKNEKPQASHSRNFDTAYDWFSTHTGLVASTDNVITVLDASGQIVDAVLLTARAAGATDTTAAATTTQANAAAAAMQWTVVSGTPPASFTGSDFHPHAVGGLAATGTSATGMSLQRKDNNDTNTKNDWASAPANPTWGANNPGQTDF